MSQPGPLLIRARVMVWSAAPLTAFFLLAGGTSSIRAQTLSPPNQPGTQAPPSPASLQPVARQVVTDVRVIGNSFTKDYVIFQKLKTRRDREFDSELVQADVRSLMATGKFRDVKTYVTRGQGGVIVTYEVFERPHIQYIEHIGNRGISEKKLGKEHGLKKGDALNAFSVEEGRRKIEELYHRSGYPKATVDIQEGDKPKDKGVMYVINEGPIQRISHVEFEGNQIASGSRLETLIESKPGYLSYASPYLSTKVDRQKIDQDVDTLIKYYRNLGFFNARIGRELIVDDSGKWVTLKFVIDEGKRYRVRSVTIEGSTKFETEPLLGFLKLKKGDFYNQDFMERDRNLLIDLYGTQGHAFADIQPDPRLSEEPGELDLIYRVAEGDVFHVGDIKVHIAGEFPHTRETVVLNRLGFRHGDLVDSREIRASERRLKYSQLFITNPAEGDVPRIVVNPPSLSSIQGLAENPPRPAPRVGAVRGQSPDRDESDQQCIYSWNGPRQAAPQLRPARHFVPKR